MNPPDLAELERLLGAAGWAKDWPHNIVPPGKPAHELACAAIRALPALIECAKALKTARDYVHDAERGHIVYPGGARIDHAMAQQDRERIDSVLTTLGGSHGQG